VAGLTDGLAACVAAARFVFPAMARAV